MKMDSATDDRSLLSWIHVGWVLNLGFAMVLFIFSDQYIRASICILSSLVLGIVYFTPKKWISAKIASVVYVLLSGLEWVLLSYAMINLEEVFVEDRPHSFLLNIIVLIAPLLYAGLRWIIAVMMIWVLWKKGKEKRKG